MDSPYPIGAPFRYTIVGRGELTYARIRAGPVPSLTSPGYDLPLTATISVRRLINIERPSRLEHRALQPGRVLYHTEFNVAVSAVVVVSQAGAVHKPSCMTYIVSGESRARSILVGYGRMFKIYIVYASLYFR